MLLITENITRNTLKWSDFFNKNIWPQTDRTRKTHAISCCNDSSPGTKTKTKIQLGNSLRFTCHNFSGSDSFSLFNWTARYYLLFFLFLWGADSSGRAVWGESLRPLASWDCEFKSRREHGCLSLANVVCCQVEASATSRSLVQRSPNVWDMSMCNLEPQAWGCTGPGCALAGEVCGGGGWGVLRGTKSVSSATYRNWMWLEATPTRWHILVLSCHTCNSKLYWR